MSDSNITMVSEDVTINVATGYVKCIFVFRNDGPAKDVLMGFPGTPILEGEEGLDFMKERVLIRNFTASANDTALPVKLEKHDAPKNYEPVWNIEYSDWYTFNVHFEPQETKIISNSYQVENTMYSTGDILTGYVIRTGKLWNGSIGHARIIFELGDIKPYEILDVKPDGFIYKDNTLLWENSDFEPESDLLIVYTQWKYTDEYLNNTSEEYRLEIKKKIAESEQILDDFESLDLEELQSFLEKMTKEEETGMALFIKSRINELAENEKSTSEKKSSSSQKNDNKAVNPQSKSSLIMGMITLAAISSLLIIFVKRKQKK